MEEREFEVINKAVLEKENVCRNCGKQLNVSPIYCLEKNSQIEEICGRCVAVVDGYGRNKKWRQYAYEKFGKYLTYPCSHKKYGCNAVLYWDDVLLHENKCTFQAIKCPASYKNIFPEETCTWQGIVKDFNKHIEEVHKNDTVNSLQINWSDIGENKYFFSCVGTQIVTIIIKFEKENIYYCSLMVNGDDIESQCYRYQLEMFDESKSNSIILRKTRLEPLISMAENLKKFDKMLEIDLVTIKQLLKQTKHVTGRFGIVRKSKKEIALITGVKNLEIVAPLKQPKENKVVDEKMLQELECPVCSEYMIPPIFMCKTGHSICNDCKNKVSMCPNCRDLFSGARNFTLEKLTSRVNYPCRNRELGCPFVTTSDKILDHRFNCELSEHPCVFHCGWQGYRSSMYIHLKATHPQSLCEANSLQICDIKDEELFYFLYVHNELFRFTLKQGTANNPKRFNVQQVCSGDSEPKFRFQLQIVDQSPVGLNFSFTSICKPLTDLKMAHSKGISVPWNLVQPFMFETDYCYYKILITRI